MIEELKHVFTEAKEAIREKWGDSQESKGVVMDLPHVFRSMVLDVLETWRAVGKPVGVLCSVRRSPIAKQESNVYCMNLSAASS